MNGSEMSNKISRYKDLGPLQALLLTACPADERGKRSIPLLARSLAVSPQYVYRWIEDNTVPQKFVSRIVSLANGRVKLEDFHPFLF